MQDKKKLPYFAFYADDFIGDTGHLTNEGIGIYIRVLCYLWKNGKINRSKIEAFAKQSLSDCSSQIEFVLELLSHDGELFYSKRLEIERQKAIDKSMINKENGAKGGKKTQSDRKANAKPNAQANASNSQSERSSNGKANAQANFNHSSSNTEVLSNDNTKITPLPPFSGESGPGLSEFLDHYRNNMGAVLISDGLDQKELESVWAELEGAGWKTPSGPITEWKSYSQKKVRALAIEKRSKPGPKGRPMSATEYARFEQEQFETCKKEFGGANELAF
jgi:uncharacterized protein YdaU (DUF1376 family)